METIGVILAGGASSRMGQDKALLTIEQSTMLSRTYQVLEKTPVSNIVICRNDGQAGHMRDLIPNKGPLSGIHSAAMRFPSANLLVVPVDLPLIDSNTIMDLLDGALESGKNSRFGKHSLPLFLRNTEAMRQTLEYTLRCTEHYSVDRFCAHFPLLELDFRRHYSLFNTNTPRQWRLAIQHVKQSSLPSFSEVTYGSCK